MQRLNFRVSNLIVHNFSRISTVFPAISLNFFSMGLSFLAFGRNMLLEVGFEIPLNSTV